MNTSSRRVILASFAALAAGLGGCADKPDAPVVYEPRPALPQLAIELRSVEGDVPQDGYVLVQDQETVARFACDLAIARFTWQGAAGEETLVHTPVPDVEQAHWSQRFRGVREIRSLIFIAPVTVRLEGSNPDAMCDAALAMGANLLIMYARSGTGANSAEVVGVVYDTSNRKPIATLHSGSQIIFDPEEGEISPGELKGDHRDIDARYQAQRRFEAHAFACIRELVGGDAPAPETQPHKWQQPLIERWWIRARSASRP